MKIELFRRWSIRGPNWYFRFVAGNGEIVATSEGYHNKEDAKASAVLVQSGFVNAEIVEV